MRLKKNRPYNHWLKSQGHYLLCFSSSNGRSQFGLLRHETKNPLQLKSHYQNTPPPTLENKNVPILRSQNTQNTRTPLKTGSEQSVQLLLSDSETLIHFRWINLKLSVPQHNNHKTHSRKLNWVFTYQHTRELEVTKLVSNLRILGKLGLVQ